MKIKLDKEVLKSILTNARLDYRGKNIIAICPWCGEDEFGISLDEFHRFGCFRKKKCGVVGNIFTLLKKVKRMDIIKFNTSFTFTENNKLINIIEENLKQEGLELETKTISKPIGFKRIYQHDYLDSRGFVKKDYERYEVGVTNLHPKLNDKYVVFLIREQGELKGFIGRSTFSKQFIDKNNKKYKDNKEKQINRYSNSITDFTKLLFGIDEINQNTKTVIIVEGLFSKINVDRLLELDKCDDVKCCATFGGKFSKEQILKLQLKSIRHIILLFEPDIINEIKKISLDSLLNQFSKIEIGDWNNSGKDPGDFNEEELFQVLNNLKDPIEYNLSKVKILELK